MNKKGMFTSNSHEWETPPNVFDKLNAEYQFTLDPAADDNNKKCDIYFTKKEDGLKQSWKHYTVFCNPPYGREIGKWVKKAYEESKNGNTIVILIPARTDTSYWHDYIFNKADIIYFIKGRLKFSGSKVGAPFPSAIIVYNHPINIINNLQNTLCNSNYHKITTIGF